MTSPNYPNEYDDYERCTIEAAAPGVSAFQVAAFSTESGYDYLTVNFSALPACFLSRLDYLRAFLPQSQSQ